jgi:hypothetical protein
MRFAPTAGLLASLSLVFVFAFAGSAAAQSGATAPPQSRNLAPGFGALPKGVKVVLMPTDIELFSISAGGVPEPKADWTESASKYFRAALVAKKNALGLTAVELSENQAEDVAEINVLHGAVARSISLHHFGILKLPTKDGKLDWSLGEATQAIKAKTGADYALFSWVRDGYVSAERQAAMVAMTILSLGRVVPGGGMQTGYASLVDLNTGRVVWFNRLQRATGDLREPDKAAETVNALLTDFPAAK